LFVRVCVCIIYIAPPFVLRDLHLHVWMTYIWYKSDHHLSSKLKAKQRQQNRRINRGKRFNFIWLLYADLFQFHSSNPQADHSSSTSSTDFSSSLIIHQGRRRIHIHLKTNSQPSATCMPYSSSFMFVPELFTPSAWLLSVLDSWRFNLKGMLACFLMNLYISTTVRSPSKVIWKGIAKTNQHIESVNVHTLGDACDPKRFPVAWSTNTWSRRAKLLRNYKLVLSEKLETMWQTINKLFYWLAMVFRGHFSSPFDLNH
jgi:hypothetical protein